MTAQQQLTAAQQYIQLWKALLPESAVPEHQQFLLWAGTYPDALVSRGITRAAAKTRRMRYSETPLNLEAAVRYATSVMKNETLGVRRHGRIQQRKTNVTETH